MSEISQRLKVLDPVIGDLISISGTIGLSYGVLHLGTILHAASFGHRNLEDKLDVDEETVFPLGSLQRRWSLLLLHPWLRMGRWIGILR
jgi:CubicO group peptidase (beta-lactamase class C family)